MLAEGNYKFAMFSPHPTSMGTRTHVHDDLYSIYSGKCQMPEIVSWSPGGAKYFFCFFPDSVTLIII